MLQKVELKSKKFQDYRGLIEDSLFDEVVSLSKELKGLKVLHINATKFGGGVAEILQSEIPLLNDLGIDAHWEVIHGDDRLFEITKAFHNAFQGEDYTLTNEVKRTFERFNAYNGHILEGDWDVILIHDPQPAAMPYFLAHNNTKFIWRCHIDTSHPNQEMWNFFEPFLSVYDAAIFTLPEFAPKNFPVENLHFIPPAIDPLVPKNIQMDEKKAKKIMTKMGVDVRRPVITQISRFDPWKDPVGVISAYKIAKKKIPELQLFMRGVMADDDPEGKVIYEITKTQAEKDPDIILSTGSKISNEDVVNAFQSASDIILQKSIREGFGLTVTEAMWKNRPVIAGNCGGIKLQIEDGKNGYLVNSVEECAQRIIKLFEDSEKRIEMGMKAHASARHNYLLPRLIRDELLVYKNVLSQKKAKKELVCK